MITKITTVEELKQIFVESLMNSTDKVTKISDGSVLNGMAYGIAKLSQKTLKDIAVIESHLFPDSASGEYLDNIAKLRGIAPRLGETKGSTYIRLVGNPGTTYVQGVNKFYGKGIEFELENTVTIPNTGFTYAKIKSNQFGSIVNIPALSITKVAPIPTGHDYCINEYAVLGGRDLENDELFRNRIKDEKNSIASGTIGYLEQILRKINPDVLRVFNNGLDSVGDLIIGVSSVSGAEFSNSELEEFYKKSEDYFSLNELKPNGLNYYGIKFKNIKYYPIDISIRADLDNSISVDRIRSEIQISLNKKLDWRYWKDGDIIDWIDLINAVKSVNGVNRVLDNYFFPNSHINIPRGYLPRIRGFVLMNLQGLLIADTDNNFKPNYYPPVSDFAYQATVLRSI